MTTNNIANRQIRIFISSTFRDMKEERDYLNNIVFPQIRQYCEQRFLQFFPIDLRWGITEEDSRNGLVLSTCIEEVDLSRPFFIGILGSRYGWQPTADDLKYLRVNIQEEKTWLKKAISEGASITEMEIEYGVLRKMDIPYASFFIRDEKVEIPQDFREERGSEAERHLDNLKKRIRNQKKYPVTEYQSIQQFGENIKQQILSMIEAEFPSTTNDWETALIQKQEYYFEKRSQFYCNLDDFYKPFEEWIETLEKVFLYTGPSLDFRTTVVATWLLRASSQRNFDYLYFDFSVGKSFGNPVDVFFKFIQLKTQKVDKDKNIIIVLDKDILDYVEADRIVRWIQSTDEHKRFIVISNTQANLSVFTTFFYSNSERKLTCDLSDELIHKYTFNYYKQYGKKLSPGQAEVIVKGKYSCDPDILNITLQTLLNYGDWNSLDVRIEEVVKSSTIDSILFLLLTETEKMFKSLKMKKELIAYKTALATIALSPGFNESIILDCMDWMKSEWPVIRPHIMLLCGNDEYGLYYKWEEWGSTIRSIISPKYLGLSLILWFANNHNRIPDVAIYILDIWERIYNYDYVEDTEYYKTKKISAKKIILALAHSPEMIKQLNNRNLSNLYSSYPLFQIPIADNTSSVMGASVDDLPISQAIEFYQRLATIAYGHNRGMDVAYCYSEIARLMDKHKMPEAILYHAKAKLAVGQAQNCIEILMPLVKKTIAVEVSDLLFVSSMQIVFDAYCQKGDFIKTKELLEIISKKYDANNLESLSEEVLEPLLGIQIQAAYCKCYYEEIGLENLENTLLPYEPFIKKRGIGHAYSYFYEMTLTNYYRRTDQITEMQRHAWLSEVAAVATYGIESFLWGRAAGMNRASHSKDLKTIKKFGFDGHFSTMTVHGKRSFSNRYLDNIPSSNIDPDVLSALERENVFWA